MNKITIAFVFIMMSAFTHAAEFKAGPLIQKYGKHAAVKQDLVLNTDSKLKVVFDVSTQSETTKVNRSFNSLARFLNMHVANGFTADNIELALVVHGKAGFDLLNNKAYQAKYAADNPNHELLGLLIKYNVKVYLCGQSAAYFNIENKALQSGVNMALSAMTAHAVLQQQGYTLNPF